MKIIKRIFGRTNKSNKTNEKQISWLEYREQWLIENSILSCDKKTINIK